MIWIENNRYCLKISRISIQVNKLNSLQVVSLNSAQVKPSELSCWIGKVIGMFFFMVHPLKKIKQIKFVAQLYNRLRQYRLVYF